MYYKLEIDLALFVTIFSKEINVKINMCDS